MRAVRFSSSEDPTIKTTNKDGSNKTPVRIEKKNTNILAKDETNMVRFEENPYLRIVSDVGCSSSGGRSRASTFHSTTIILQKGFIKTSPGRVTQTFSQKLGTYFRGPRCINLNKSLQNTLFESTCSKLCVKKSRNEQGTEGTYSSRERGKAEEKSNISGRSYAGEVYKLTIPFGEKRPRSVSNDKFEERKLLRAIGALQNGKFDSPPVSRKEGRLYVQAGFEGCLLLRTSPQRISKICLILMRWKTLCFA